LLRSGGAVVLLPGDDFMPARLVTDSYGGWLGLALGPCAAHLLDGMTLTVGAMDGVVSATADSFPKVGPRDGPISQTMCGGSRHAINNNGPAEPTAVRTHVVVQLLPGRLPLSAFAVGRRTGIRPLVDGAGFTARGTVRLATLYAAARSFRLNGHGRRHTTLVQIYSHHWQASVRRGRPSSKRRGRRTK
jgi:hypothetical protein